MLNLAERVKPKGVGPEVAARILLVLGRGLIKDQHVAYLRFTSSVIEHADQSPRELREWLQTTSEAFAQERGLAGHSVRLVAPSLVRALN